MINLYSSKPSFTRGDVQVFRGKEASRLLARAIRAKFGLKAGSSGFKTVSSTKCEFSWVNGPPQHEVEAYIDANYGVGMHNNGTVEIKTHVILWRYVTSAVATQITDGLLRHGVITGDWSKQQQRLVDAEWVQSGRKHVCYIVGTDCFKPAINPVSGIHLPQEYDQYTVVRRALKNTSLESWTYTLPDESVTLDLKGEPGTQAAANTSSSTNGNNPLAGVSRVAPKYENQGHCYVSRTRSGSYELVIEHRFNPMQFTQAEAGVIAEHSELIESFAYASRAVLANKIVLGTTDILKMYKGFVTLILPADKSIRFGQTKALAIHSVMGDIKAFACWPAEVLAQAWEQA